MELNIFEELIFSFLVATLLLALMIFVPLINDHKDGKATTGDTSNNSETQTD